MTGTPLLEVEGLHVDVGAPRRIHAVRGVTFEVEPSERLGIVGESGSGKSMTAAALLRLLPPTAEVVSGSVRFAEDDVLSMSEEQIHRVRGGDIGMVFQNARTALNPVFTVGEQIADVYRVHTGAKPEDAWQRAVAVLDDMGIPAPAARAEAYPHQLSGGMAQRAMIGMALVAAPKLLIADEPTTGLDVTIEAQVLDLIVEHVAESGAALILISHDLGVIARTCERLVVMYAGEVFEAGPVELILDRPSNPYTRLLLRCFDLDEAGRPTYIPGRVPDLSEEPAGCPFAARCPFVVDVCRQQAPQLRSLADGRQVTCHRAEEVLAHDA